MKGSYLVFAILAFAIGCASADDITTIDGKVLKGVTISAVEPDGLKITTDDGIEKIPFTNLPEDVQKKYGYDPTKAKKFTRDLSEQQQQQLAAKRAAERRAAAPKATSTPEPKSTPEPAEDTGFKISAIPATDTLGQITHRVVVRGKVIQRSSKGLLIDCSSGRGIGNHAKGMIWLTGLDAREDALISGLGTLIGTFTYTAVSGAERVADCYHWDSGTVK